MKDIKQYIYESKNNKALVNFVHKFGSKDE